MVSELFLLRGTTIMHYVNHMTGKSNRVLEGKDQPFEEIKLKCLRTLFSCFLFHPGFRILASTTPASLLEFLDVLIGTSLYLFALFSFACFVLWKFLP